MTQMEKMLGKVLKLTEKGKLKWSTTVNPQAFVTVLGKQSVVISKHVSGGWEDVYMLEVRSRGGLPIAILRTDSHELAKTPPAPPNEMRRKMEKVFACAGETAVYNGLAEIINKLDELIAESNRA